MFANAHGYGLNFCELKTKNMKNRIELTIEHKDHGRVELTNGKGDTFNYDPIKNEGLEDFLNGAKILPIADVSISLPSRKDYDDRKLKPMFFKEDTTVDGKVLFVKGDEWQPYNWNYRRTIEYLKDGRLGYEC